MLFFSLINTFLAQGQEENFNCQSNDPEIAKIADSLEKGREDEEIIIVTISHSFPF